MAESNYKRWAIKSMFGCGKTRSSRHILNAFAHQAELHETRMRAEHAEAELMAANRLGVDPQTVTAL